MALPRPLPAPFVEIAVAMPVLGPFTYTVPEGMALEIGHAVLVPFGNRKVSGYVVGFSQEGPPKGVKAVERLLDPVPALDQQQLGFLRWAADYYLCGLGEMIATALPSSYRGRSHRVFLPAAAGIEALAEKSVEEGPVATVLREVVARPAITRGGLARSLHQELEPEEVGRALDHLVRHGLVATEERERAGPAGKVPWIRLLADPAALPSPRGARMRGVLAALVEAGGAMPLAELVAREGEGARAAATRLAKEKLVIREEREDRSAVAPAEEQAPSEPPTPTPEQAAALVALASTPARPWLVHGVTGSGKTEIYLQAAARVLEQGRQVLVLVPEIALTPQLTGRFQARFGDRVAVLHSGLTPAERLREWRRIRAREAEVAVGARSALFAPFTDLGLIVVDEEELDGTNSGIGVSLELPLCRAGCPVALGSATPRLESWHNAQEGRYGSLRLLRRATPRPVPAVELVDMRGRPLEEALAPELSDALSAVIADGGQAIVLYNRRGYAPVVECPDCGAGYSCPSCGTSMVYHQKRGRITCHYCGFWRAYQPDCPICGGVLGVAGHGTERVEEELRRRFPGIGILRMDADTTTGRGSHHQILSAFRAGEAQLLVGTQLVAKGHDFPDVHLAAVVGVDHILTMPDFRSAERTWALVTQLAGRAGRGSRAGRVLVQTRHADHFVFRLLGTPGAETDLDAFYTEESRQRRLLAHPPFSRLVMVRVEGADRDAALGRAQEIARILRQAARPLGRKVDVLGPAPAPMSRLVGRWRFQLVLRGRDVPAFRRWLGEVRGELHKPGRKGTRVILDVDPRSLG